MQSCLYLGLVDSMPGTSLYFLMLILPSPHFTSRHRYFFVHSVSSILRSNQVVELLVFLLDAMTLRLYE
jgi:hypothetical protein